MKKYFFILLLSLIIDNLISAQVNIAGVVVDFDNKSILSFVNIGIRNKNIGSCSAANGTFSLGVPQQNENDTLTFSIVGYQELNIPLAEILNTKQKIFQLKKKAVALKEVSVTADKLTEKKLGIVNYHPLLHFLDGSTNQNDIFEIAQLIKLDATPVKITSVNLHINEERKDSGIFRINFYSYNGKIPDEKIIEKNIIQTKEIKPGWLKFDLSEYDIRLKGNVVVAIEFIPSEKKMEPIYYEVKLGGSSSSFVRGSSQGTWTIPQHHYRMFITALVDDKTKKLDKENSEDTESLPAFTIYSGFVRDSFSIFVNLPADYSKNKGRKFPVIYLLDANAYFDLLKRLINENKYSQSILVGIGYKNVALMDSLRDRDFTFPKALPGDSFLVSGGGDKFLEFIEEELIPVIDKKYSSDEFNRSLMGHSLGGYFPLFALENELRTNNNYFKNFIAASPSLEYCDNYIQKKFASLKQNQITVKPFLYLTYGADEDSEEGGTGTVGMDNFNSFVKLLSDNSFSNLRLKSEVFPSARHMQTPVPTFTNALKELIP